MCSRPRKYGNPLVDRDNPALAAAAFEAALDMRRDGTLPEDQVMWSYPSDADIAVDLRGLDLACWYRLDAPCHVDTLLRVANA